MNSQVLNAINTIIDFNSEDQAIAALCKSISEKRKETNARLQECMSSLQIISKINSAKWKNQTIADLCDPVKTTKSMDDLYSHIVYKRYNKND